MSDTGVRGANCPDLGTLLHVVTEEASESEKRMVRTHLSGCDACRALADDPDLLAETYLEAQGNESG